MKKPKINIDFQQLLVSKGEKIGLCAAVAICVLLVYVGVNTYVHSGKPEEHAAELAEVANKKKKEMENESVPATLEQVTKSLIPSNKKIDPIDPGGIALRTLPIDPRPGDDGKRRPPRILMPEEWTILSGFVQL